MRTLEFIYLAVARVVVAAFWLALLFALLLHAYALLSLSAPHIDYDPEAPIISVCSVTEAIDL
jgi:hypothetical protein